VIDNQIAPPVQTVSGVNAVITAHGTGIPDTSSSTVA
jgi:hypothetical protein